MSFNDQQIKTLVILERLGGSLSLVSVSLVFLAYGFFPRMRTVPNTFIVFASIANAGASAGSVIAYDGLFKGEASSLCQAQGFMFEFFIQSDPWWALAMAINVLLIFFTKTKPATIKKRGWLYCLLCYGGPFVIALICLQLRDPNKTPVYGNAGLWCWITSDWGPLRIYSYYMLIWICILASVVIYIGVGTYVFRVRNRLHQVTGSGKENRHVRGMISYSANETEVSRSRRETYTSPMITQRSRLSSHGSEWVSIPGQEHVEGTVNILTEVNVHVEDTHGGSIPGPPLPDVIRPEAAHLPPITNSASVRPADKRPRVETTISSSPAEPTVKRTRSKRAAASVHRVLDRFAVVDPVKRAYLRTSVLFGVSVLVTWIPSSINRIYSLVSNSNSPYQYNLATATVLPLQGVWNGIIFFVTSWRIFKECIRELRAPRHKVIELTPSNARSMSVQPQHGAEESDEEKILRASEGKEAGRRVSWGEASGSQHGAESSGTEVEPSRPREWDSPV
ncbi:hypothetical protein GQ53DRAFT_831180 [Thozetella sp. PMI_491]|nr:hypothetical protein GQ53DRAFT_831180 [Thozetella sp. PMI_491]